MRPVPVIPITTSRLTLREPTLSDMHQLRSEADDWEVAARLSTMPYPYTEVDARFFLTTIQPQLSVWAICPDKAGRVFAGLISLKSEQDSASAELGYWLGRRFWNNGYVTEASEVIIRYVRSLGSHSRLTSGYFEGNHASGKVLRKVGFVECGQSTRFNVVRGESVGHVEMKLEL